MFNKQCTEKEIQMTQKHFVIQKFHPLSKEECNLKWQWEDIFSCLAKIKRLITQWVGKDVWEQTPLYYQWEHCMKSYLAISQSVSSVTQSCLTLCDPMNYSMPGLPVHHQLLDFTQTHVHRVGDAIQPSHPLSSPSPPAPNPSQHQGLFQWVNYLHEVAIFTKITDVILTLSFYF